MNIYFHAPTLIEAGKKKALLYPPSLILATSTISPSPQPHPLQFKSRGGVKFSPRTPTFPWGHEARALQVKRVIFYTQDLRTSRPSAAAKIAYIQSKAHQNALHTHTHTHINIHDSLNEERISLT